MYVPHDVSCDLVGCHRIHPALLGLRDEGSAAIMRDMPQKHLFEFFVIRFVYVSFTRKEVVCYAAYLAMDRYHTLSPRFSLQTSDDVSLSQVGYIYIWIA